MSEAATEICHPAASSRQCAGLRHSHYQDNQHDQHQLRSKSKSKSKERRSDYKKKSKRKKQKKLKFKMGFKTKKLADYIRRDRIARVVAYIEKYGHSVAKMPLDVKGRTALHLACRHASLYSFAFLLRLSTNLMKTDAEGNLPLHWALDATKKGNSKAYTDMVLPLIRMCKGAQDVPNRRGITPRQILVEMEIAEETERLVAEDESSDEDEEEVVSNGNMNIENDNSDDAWNAKLREELDDDCTDSWGRYENINNEYNDVDGSSETETFDEWTNRMFSEYHSKHSRRPSMASRCESEDSNSIGRSRGGSGKSKSSWTKEDQMNFENECRQQEDARRRLDVINETLSRTKQKSQFNEKHARLFRVGSTKCIIRLDDLPWTHILVTDNFLPVLFVDIDPSDLVAKKKCLREQQVQWHPDKFLQKFSNRLAEEDREEIVSSVNHFAQIINAALDNLTR